MIEIDLDRYTYTCPYCCKQQSFAEKINMACRNLALLNFNPFQASEVKSCDAIDVYHIKCSNKQCKKISIVGFFSSTQNQFDILPQHVHKIYPDYIPKQIRDDYTEAADIIELSPKAAATLFRRCLQGMIHDFWNIHEKNLNAEISALKDKVPLPLWNALDGLRKIGNIGAHMEQDVNLIVDIDISEAKKLQKLIEMLFDKWYIARHDEEELFNEIIDTSDKKQAERKDR